MRNASAFRRAVIACILAASPVASTSAQSLPGLRLWLDASDPATITTDGGGLITAWADKSGNSFHATQTNADRQPTVAAAVIGGKPGIRFDSAGAADPLSDGLAINTGLNLGRPYTVFIVDQYWGAIQGRSLQGRGQNWLLGKWGGANGGGNAYYAGGWVGPAGGVPATINIPTISTGTGSFNSAGFYINGRTVASAPVGGAPGNLQIGVVGAPPGNPPFDEPSQVEVAEVLAYNRSLGFGERQSVESYLGSKYNIPVQTKWLSARAEVFTGADPGEGLDFSGTFLHAVNARGPGGFSIGDATFTDDSGIIVAENEILNWFPSGFAVQGDDDTNLNTLMQSIRWSNASDGGIDSVTMTLPGLTVGRIYKLQLLTGDVNTTRHWAISIEGDKVFADFNGAAYTGTSAALGVAVVHEFVATDTTLDIVFDSIGLTFGDINPIIQAVTLEDEGPAPGTAVTKLVNGPADLDFSGTFVYAVNALGPALGQIGDANFTDDTVAGITITAPNTVGDGAWVTPDFGNTTDDDNLEAVLRTIRWSDTTSQEKTLALDLNNLTPGQTYKLQLLFDEASNGARGFDIAINGIKIIDDFSTSPSFNNPAAVAAIINFTAPGDSIHVTLEGFATPFTDRNPILAGFTLEQTADDGDSDDDGLPDQWELDNFMDLDEIATGDPDNDNLTNLEEFNAGTDPTNADPDNDTLTDDVELALGTNPFSDDTDMDGLKDNEEVNTYHTNPRAADTDLDFLSDGAEVAGNTDPLILDTDGDGYSDPVELIALSSPTDAGSTPPPGTYAANFTGGDIGDGLDLDGDFLFAVNVGTNGAPGLIRDADFTTDSVPGVAIATQYEIPNWNAAGNLGDSANDNALEIALASIRWSDGRDTVLPEDVPLTLSGLTVGSRYKLQLLFNEVCCPNRGFDVLFDGALILDDFRPGILQNEPRTRTGAIVIHEFVAAATTVAITLDSSTLADPGITDPNPILNAFTLETLPSLGGFAITAVSRTATAIAIEYNGTNGKTYAIDYKETLDASFWEEVDDNSIATGPGTLWSDTSAFRLANPNGFYRVRDAVLQPDPNGP
jgi:hypothetical protein